jgi:hypothetical protein
MDTVMTPVSLADERTKRLVARLNYPPGSRAAEGLAKFLADMAALRRQSREETDRYLRELAELKAWCASSRCSDEGHPTRSSP